MRIVIIPSASDRIIVDSSGWIEYLGGGRKADDFAAYLDSQAVLFLPSIVVYEVHKKLYREAGKTPADQFISKAFEYGERVIPLSIELSILASKTSLEERLSMADAIIYVTAFQAKAQLITCDSHFENLPGVTIL
jgi:predicted nucleic acid-binding protein